MNQTSIHINYKDTKDNNIVHLQEHLLLSENSKIKQYQLQYI